MKRGCRKPGALAWVFCLLLLPVGIYFSNVEHYSRLLSGVGLGAGIGGLAVLCWCQYRHQRLSPEEKRELERAERDERNVAIREKAGLLTWRVLLFALLLSAAAGAELELSGGCLCYGLAVFGIAVNLGAAAWYRRRM